MVESFSKIFLSPFYEYDFMRHALLACVATSVTSGILGVILVLRRLSLVGDALSHGILPGIAIAYLSAGFSFSLMSVGGLIAGVLIAVLASYFSKHTKLREDATLSGFYLFSLALGVLLLSLSSGGMKVSHLLFGNVLAITTDALFLIFGISFLTITLFLVFSRMMIFSYFDEIFMTLTGVKTRALNMMFLILVVLNLVASSQTLGTLMALGMMMLPAIAANLMVTHMWSLFILSGVISITCSYFGLVLSFALNMPTGPFIVLLAGIFYFIGLGFYMLRERTC